MSARAETGAPADVARFCEEQHRRVVATLAVYCGDPALAEELAQEALARACQHWHRVKDMEAPGAWLHKVALNLARSRFRRRAIERRVLARGGTSTVHYDAEVSEMVALHEALADLPERRRKVVVLRHVSGLTVTETAAAMGISENAVRSLTSRGIAQLREALQDADREEAHRA